MWSDLVKFVLDVGCREGVKPDDHNDDGGYPTLTRQFP
jgi:hypothetical protein